MKNDVKLHGKIEFLVPSSQGGDHLLTLDFETGEELRGILQHAQKSGWKPRFFGSGAPGEHPQVTSSNGSTSGTPTCPVHQKPMKQSKEGEGWFCPRKTNGEWCKTRSLDGIKTFEVA